MRGQTSKATDLLLETVRVKQKWREHQKGHTPGVKASQVVTEVSEGPVSLHGLGGPGSLKLRPALRWAQGRGASRDQAKTNASVLFHLMLELISANNFSKYNQQQMKIAEHMWKGGTVSQGGEREWREGNWGEEEARGDEEGKGGRTWTCELRFGAPGQTTTQGPGERGSGRHGSPAALSRRERRATGSNEHSPRRIQRLLLWATRFYKLTSTCNVLHLQIFMLFLTFQITQ